MLDVDVVLLFPDGGKIILPGFAFSVVALSAPELMGPQGPIDPQHFLSLVGDTKVADQLPTVRLTDLQQQAPKVENPSPDPTAAAGVGPGEADPAPPPPPIKIVTLTPLVDTGHYREESPVKISVVKSENFTSYASPSPPPSQHTEDKKADPAPPAPPVVHQDAQIDFKMLAYTKQSTETLPTGGEQISGGFGVAEAATDPAYAVQSAPEVINGTVQADIILPDDFGYAPQGTAPRVIDMTVTPTIAGASVTSVTISGMPDGISVIGATKGADGYTVDRPDQPTTTPSSRCPTRCRRQDGPTPPGSIPASPRFPIHPGRSNGSPATSPRPSTSPSATSPRTPPPIASIR